MEGMMVVCSGRTGETDAFLAARICYIFNERNEEGRIHTLFKLEKEDSGI